MPKQRFRGIAGAAISARHHRTYAIEHGWSREVMAEQIERKLHARQGKLQSNFELTLPPATSDMAAQLFKDPYIFDFVGTADPRRERKIEQALIDHLERAHRAQRAQRA